MNRSTPGLPVHHQFPEFTQTHILRVGDAIQEERPVPFERMIYFGDGETDVPCMRTIKANGGHSFAVYGNDKKRALAQQLLSEGRVNFACPADYTADGQMIEIVKRILDKVKADYTLQQHEAVNRDTLNMFSALGDMME